MSASEPRAFIVHYPRTGCVVGSLIFGAAAYGLLIYYTHHPREFDPRYGVASALGWWFIFVCVAGSLLVCVKTVIFPSLLFAADFSGVRLGRGIFKNRVTNIDWRHVIDIRASSMPFSMGPAGPMISRYVPALEIVFDPSVVLPSTGLDLAYSSGDKFLLAQSVIGCSPDELIGGMRDLKGAADQGGH
jgi:hypothetical protein